MTLETFNLLMLIIVVVLFGLGLLTSIVGIVILATRAVSNSDVGTLAIQTTRLAQKGLSENIAGLVGNASALLEAINQLVRTTAGIGVFLTVIGILLMVVSGVLVLQLI